MKTSISSAYSLNSQWSITDDITLKSNMNICGALRDLVQFVQSHAGVIILVKLLVNLLVNLHEALGHNDSESFVKT